MRSTQMIPGAQQSRIEGAGHLGNIERPAEFDTLVGAFIRGVDSTICPECPLSTRFGHHRPIADIRPDCENRDDEAGSWPGGFSFRR